MGSNATSNMGRGAVRLARILTVVAGALVAAGGCGGGGGGTTDTTATPGTSSTASASNGSNGTASRTQAASQSASSASAAPTAAAPGSSTTTAADPAPASGPTAAAPTPAPANTTSAAPSASPAPAAPAATPAPAGTTAAAAPAPAAAASHPGTIIPLYTSPAWGDWAAVAATKKAHPSVPVLAVIDPANGPGTAALSDYMAGIAKLTAAGVKVIGYVHTSYGKRAPSEIQVDIDRWHSLYTGVTGIFLDEMANTPGSEAMYKNATSYAKSHGFDYTIGNPGADGGASYLGSVDTMLIYESGGLPSTSFLAGWHTAHDRRNFGIIPYGITAVDPAFVRTAAATCGYVFLSNDQLPNPWDTLPAYLDQLVGVLATI